ncbi:MAG: ABC transporter substrate-binding protein [Actinomycetota bacterium]|nr:ABC transporter substrate-binding protein [Actinomycetota bacterium]
MRNLWRVLVALVALTFVAAACSDSDPDASASDDAATEAGEESGESSESSVASGADDSTLVFAATGDINSMDPSITGVEWNRVLGVNVYETLVNYALEPQDDGSLLGIGLDVAPGLASEWEIDGDSVTFTLQEGVTFYPSGNPMTAEDVRYSIIRTVRLPGSTGTFNANLAGIFEPEDQIEVVDDQTVRINFTDAEGNPRRTAMSLPSLRFPQFSVVDSAVFEENATEEDPWAAEWAEGNVAGTGHYYVDSYTPGSEIVLAAVPDFWGEPPAYEQVIMRVVGGADVTSLMLGDEVDMASSGLGSRELDALEEAGFQIINQPVPDIIKAEMVTTAAPFDDPAFRQAIAHAIPYDQILEIALGGRGERAYSIVNPASPSYVPAWDIYGDPEEAAALIEESGAAGATVPIYFNNGIAAMEDIALLISDALGGLGLNVEVNGLPTVQYTEERTNLTTGSASQISGMLLSSGVIWLDDADPNVDLWLKSTGFSNPTGWANEEVDRLHAEFRFSPDPDARAEAYATVQELGAEGAAYAPIAVAGVNVALRPGIEGASFTSDPHPRFWTMSPAE